MAYAIDRKTPPTSARRSQQASGQPGIVAPTYNDWLDSRGRGHDTYNPTRRSGPDRRRGPPGSDGILAEGKKLSFTIINNGGYSDWVASISVCPRNSRRSASSSRRRTWPPRTSVGLYTGNYQLATMASTAALRRTTSSASGCTQGHRADRAERLDQLGALHQPVHRHAARLLRRDHRRRSSTASWTSCRRSCSGRCRSSPWSTVDWYQYNDRPFTGWATPSDPYALPAVYEYPDRGQVLLHLSK